MGNYCTKCLHPNSCRVVPINWPNPRPPSRSENREAIEKRNAELFAAAKRIIDEVEPCIADRPKNPSPREGEQSNILPDSEALALTSVHSIVTTGVQENIDTSNNTSAQSEPNGKREEPRNSVLQQDVMNSSNHVVKHVRYVPPPASSAPSRTMVNNRGLQTLSGISSRGYIFSGLTGTPQVRQNTNSRPIGSYSRHLVNDMREEQLAAARNSSFGNQGVRWDYNEFGVHQQTLRSSQNRFLRNDRQQLPKNSASTRVGESRETVENNDDSYDFSWNTAFDISRKPTAR